MNLQWSTVCIENKTLDLQTAFDQALALETAQKSYETYNLNTLTRAAATSSTEPEEQNKLREETGESFESLRTQIRLARIIPPIQMPKKKKYIWS
ncbi:Hypothetical predicted protein [Paramuricea clavata]|uniref:Uncharacterized protein n=1 Tax=Paramuricea clavata TaxID=317549 RepID=A0A7D9I5U0_PARCT|nr:Hypothetical predicted protein [Paramuricea clavata]